jgi:DNA-binding beta-propeller fold protein YncE
MCTILGMPGMSLDNGATGQARSFGLHFPVGVLGSSTGEVWAADEANHRVVKLGTDGKVVTAAGIGYVGDSVEGPLLTSPLHGPSGLAWQVPKDAANPGIMLVSLIGTNRIVRLDFGTGKLSFVAGTGNPGFDGDGKATEHALDVPSGLAWGPDGTIYFADMGNDLVREVTPAGALVTLAGKQGLGEHPGDAGPAAAAHVHTPVGVALIGQSLYFSDAGSHTIRRIDLADKTMHLVAGATDQADHVDGPASDARFNFPTGLAPDGTSGLFVTEEVNHCVRRIDLASGNVETWAGQCGKSGFAGDSGPRGDALLNAPMGIATDPSGNVLIGDTNNDIVREVHR